MTVILTNNDDCLHFIYYDQHLINGLCEQFDDAVVIYAFISLIWNSLSLSIRCLHGFDLFKSCLNLSVFSMSTCAFLLPPSNPPRLDSGFCNHAFQSLIYSSLRSQTTCKRLDGWYFDYCALDICTNTLDQFTKLLAILFRRRVYDNDSSNVSYIGHETNSQNALNGPIRCWPFEQPSTDRVLYDKISK